ncbi:MAG: hypothetical protein EKK41_22645 [Hyphomicrobiales bacterium]|nr:MAG: hypothetical protein EKK41_22645 [Hyphomicrobiales bacterium]
MHTSARTLFAAVLLGASALALSTAHAAQQDEIQVYTDDINKKGETGLEVHLNTTPQGRTKPDYPGEITNNHGFRFTPEFSYGLTSDVELGFYLPMLIDGAGDFYVVGSKYRVKWMPVRPKDDATGWFLGANTELSNVDRKFSQSRWSTELRPIVGYKGKDWLFSFNPILDWDLSDGLQSWEPTFVPSVKLSKEVAKGLSIGAEYYSDMGKLAHIEPWNKQDNRIYGIIDVDMKPLVFNFGVGYGLTEASDRWTVKAIIEVPINGSK